jgi:hypothetical protein
MSKTKIAPVLSALLDDLRTKTIRYPLRRTAVGDLQILRLAKTELRDVLAALRAGERHHNHAYMDTSDEARCSFCRALSRLARASKEPR